MPVIPDGYAQVNWRFSGPNAPTGAEVTLGFAVEEGVMPVEMAVKARDNWIQWLSTMQTADISLTSVTCKFGPNLTGASATVGANQGGGQSVNPEVPQTALLVTKLTGAGGRAGRGRMFIPGIIESSFDSSGTMVASQLLAWNNALDSWHTDMLSEAMVPVLLHGADSPIPAPLLITDFQAQGRAATQRRRMRR